MAGIRQSLGAVEVVKAAIADRDTAESTVRLIVENGLQNAVTAFQRCAEALYSRFPSVSKARRDAFQNLTDSDALWKEAAGRAYADYLSTDAMSTLRRAFQQRHLLAHTQGIVDQDYINKSGDDRYRPGQRIVVRGDTVQEAVGHIERLVSGMIADAKRKTAEREPHMTADQYLSNILAREAVNTGIGSPVLAVRNTLLPTLQEWGGGRLAVDPSGSFAKGTANRSGTDIDLFLSVSQNVPNTMKEIYETLFAKMSARGYQPKRQNVSINVKVGGFDVDLVPGKRQNGYDSDHSLYRRRADTWIKTNIVTHISHVMRSGRADDIRILKLWRNQKGLDFPSSLELTVINALAGNYGTLSAS